MRSPRTASSAGRKVSAKTTASPTTMTPPIPMAQRYEPRKKSSPERPVATATPENPTTRPAVPIARTSAASWLWPAASSSRYRLTMKSE